jgi:Flp pilus assembly protein TadD
MNLDTFFHPHPDPEVAAVVERLASQMNELGARYDELLPALQAGKPLAELHEGAQEDPQALLALALRLHDGGESRHALPIAMYLVAHHGQDHRHTFLAGMCLQTLGRTQEALAMYWLHMNIAGAQPAPMYRVAMCLQSHGNQEGALAAFEEAFNLGHANNDYRHIQDLAAKRIDQLRASR